MRAAHSLFRAGWMLTEINGVLRCGYISPTRFQKIQQHAIALEQLQRKFGPPPTISSSTDAKLLDINITRHRLPVLRVMNRGVEAAAAVLSHHGWHLSQVRNVLKPPSTDLDDLSLTFMDDLPGMLHHHQQSSKKSAVRTFIMLFWCGGLVFLGVSLIFHML